MNLHYSNEREKSRHFQNSRRRRSSQCKSSKIPTRLNSTSREIRHTSISERKKEIRIQELDRSKPKRESETTNPGHKHQEKKKRGGGKGNCEVERWVLKWSNRIDLMRKDEIRVLTSLNWRRPRSPR